MFAIILRVSLSDDAAKRSFHLQYCVSDLIIVIIKIRGRYKHNHKICLAKKQDKEHLIGSD